MKVTHVITSFNKSGDIFLLNTHNQSFELDIRKETIRQPGSVIEFGLKEWDFVSVTPVCPRLYLDIDLIQIHFDKFEKSCDNIRLFMNGSEEARIDKDKNQLFIGNQSYDCRSFCSKVDFHSMKSASWEKAKVVTVFLKE